MYLIIFTEIQENKTFEGKHCNCIKLQMIAYFLFFVFSPPKNLIIKVKIYPPESSEYNSGEDDLLREDGTLFALVAFLFFF
jgi:hypothetical protein